MFSFRWLWAWITLHLLDSYNAQINISSLADLLECSSNPHGNLVYEAKQKKAKGKYRLIFEIQSPDKRQVSEEHASTLEHMQVTNGTGQLYVRVRIFCRYVTRIENALWKPARRGGAEVVGWTLDRKIWVRFPAYPHRVWALWWQGGKRRTSSDVPVPVSR